MQPINKRQADEDPKPARAPKRRAATPTTTRLTRSAHKQLAAENATAAELNPGLTITPRKRKTAAPHTKRPAPDARPTSGTSADALLLEMLPATTYVPPSKPTQQQQQQQSTSVPSVVYAVGATPDGSQICAPIRMGSPRVEAALSGAAPMQAHVSRVYGSGMDGNQAPLTFLYGINVAPQQPIGHRRAASHSSLISPTSGPADPYAPAVVPYVPGLEASGESTIVDLRSTEEDLYDWRHFKIGWDMRFVDAAEEMDVDGVCKASNEEAVPAVVEATYAVESAQDAAELFVNEMYALGFQQYSECTDCSDCSDCTGSVVEITVTESPVDIFPEDRYSSQMAVNAEPSRIVHGAAVDSVDVMDCTTGSEETTESSWHGYETDGTPSAASSKASLSSSNANKRSSSASTNSSPSSETIPQSTSTSASLETCHPPQKTAQELASLQREKVLREHLIKVRKARLAKQCPQNVLVRESDGSLSVASVEALPVAIAPWSSQWLMDEDQYSVEEYDEDTVSY